MGAEEIFGHSKETQATIDALRRHIEQLTRQLEAAKRGLHEAQQEVDRLRQDRYASRSGGF